MTAGVVRIALVAGEASGDLLASQLIEAIRGQHMPKGFPNAARSTGNESDFIFHALSLNTGNAAPNAIRLTPTMR